jgi:hypothetical protein
MEIDQKEVKIVGIVFSEGMNDNEKKKCLKCNFREKKCLDEDYIAIAF